MRNRLRSTAFKLAALWLGAAIVAACQPNGSGKDDHDNAAAAGPQMPSLPIVEPPYDRGRILLAVGRAASAYSAGIDDSANQRRLEGKRFEVRLRFGCEGQGPGKGDHGWSIDPDGRTLRLRAVPSISLKDSAVRALANEGTEAVEGFWLRRPWLLDAACPSIRPTTTGTGSEAASVATTNPEATDEEESEAAPSAAPRIGIAQFFTPNDSRTGRRIDRPFETVKQLAEGETVGENGFDLVLSGRLRGHGGRVIHCWGEGANRPPDCIVSTDMDRVRIERPNDKAVMAEWTV